MRTGERIGARRPAALLALLLLAVGAGCNPPPDIRVLLQSSSDTIEAGATALLTATVTEDGRPLTAVDVLFEADNGTFLDGPQVTTNDVGQATVRLQVDTGGIMVSITASAVDMDALGSITITVESGGGGGGDPER